MTTLQLAGLLAIAPVMILFGAFMLCVAAGSEFEGLRSLQDAAEDRRDDGADVETTDHFGGNAA